MQMKQSYFLDKMSVNKIYIPGSVWLYYKLYTGPKLADRILTLYILPIIIQIYDNRLIDKFFFIRYNDPDFHIRIRFKTKYINDLINILTPVWEQLVMEQKISKVVIDSYEQEIGRYENENMDIVESVFCVDSYSCIQILRHLQYIGEDLSNARWLLSIKLIDGVLNALKYNNMQRFSLMSNLAKGFREEFFFTAHNFTKQINEKYRLYYFDICSIMKNEDSPIDNIINERTKQLLMLFASMKLNVDNVERIIGSIIHMSMNRWFRSQNRLYEMMVYSFMEKYYKQQLFQKSKSNNFENNK